MSEFIDIYKRAGGNQAVEINKPYNVDIHLTEDGSDWFWSAFCIFMVLIMLVLFFMFKKPATERLFYYTALAPVLFMTINYFTLASNLGWVPIKVKYNHARTASEHGHHGTRQVFYSRYIGWFMSFPWPIIQASLLGNTPLWQIAFNVAITEVYVVVMLLAAMVHTTYKWGYFSLAVASGIVACISVMTTTRNLVKNMSPNVMIFFLVYFSIVMFLWFGYPISFGLSEGGNVMQPDSEGIFYGILDCLLFGVLPVLYIPVVSHFGLEELGLNYTINHYGQEQPKANNTSRPHEELPKMPPAHSSEDTENGESNGAKHPGKKTRKVKKVKKVKRPVRSAPSEEEYEDPAGEKTSVPSGGATPESQEEY